MASAFPAGLKLLLAGAALAFSAALAAPERASAQTDPPCISCSPGEDAPSGPPEISYSPSDASFLGDAAGRPQYVEITVCAYAGIQTSTRRIVFNGDDVTAQFGLASQGGGSDPGCAQRYVYAAWYDRMDCACGAPRAWARR